MQLNVPSVWVLVLSCSAFVFFMQKHSCWDIILLWPHFDTSPACVCLSLCVCVCQQVVHEAYTRFTEESLTQSVCDKPSERTEVTIKVSDGTKKVLFSTKTKKNANVNKLKYQHMYHVF